MWILGFLAALAAVLEALAIPAEEGNMPALYNHGDDVTISGEGNVSEGCSFTRTRLVGGKGITCCFSSKKDLCYPEEQTDGCRTDGFNVTASNGTCTLLLSQATEEDTGNYFASFPTEDLSSEKIEIVIAKKDQIADVAAVGSIAFVLLFIVVVTLAIRKSERRKEVVKPLNAALPSAMPEIELMEMDPSGLAEPSESSKSAPPSELIEPAISSSSPAPYLTELRGSASLPDGAEQLPSLMAPPTSLTDAFTVHNSESADVCPPFAERPPPLGANSRQPSKLSLDIIEDEVEEEEEEERQKLLREVRPRVVPRQLSDQETTC